MAFCEIDPFCRKVLRKHWPEVPCYEDITKLNSDVLRADGIAVDAICGGFPCQDISFAGSGAGIKDGTRSGLWSHYARLIGELRPKYIIVENVAALLTRGLDRVLGDLAALGYDAEWHCIPASAVGAPHRRDRLWIVAYAKCDGWHQAPLVRYFEQLGRCLSASCKKGGSKTTKSLYGSSSISDWGCFEAASYDSHDSERPSISNHWDYEPEVGRVVDGISIELVQDEIHALGNAVVPQISEIIGRAIADINLIGRK